MEHLNSVTDNQLWDIMVGEEKYTFTNKDAFYSAVGASGLELPACENLRHLHSRVLSFEMPFNERDTLDAHLSLINAVHIKLCLCLREAYKSDVFHNALHRLDCFVCYDNVRFQLVFPKLRIDAEEYSALMEYLYNVSSYKHMIRRDFVLPSRETYLLGTGLMRMLHHWTSEGVSLSATESLNAQRCPWKTDQERNFTLSSHNHSIRCTELTNAQWARERRATEKTQKRKEMDQEKEARRVKRKELDDMNYETKRMKAQANFNAAKERVRRLGSAFSEDTEYLHVAQRSDILQFTYEPVTYSDALLLITTAVQEKTEASYLSLFDKLCAFFFVMDDHLCFIVQDPDPRWPMLPPLKKFFDKRITNTLKEEWFTLMVGEKEKFLLDEFISYRLRQRYLCKEFHPEPAFNTPGIINTFFGWRAAAIPPTEPPYSVEFFYSDQGALRLFLEHIFYDLCNQVPEQYCLLMWWMAHIVQRPWEKTGRIVSITGPAGVGKSYMIGDVFMKAVLGHHQIVVRSADDLHGHFNPLAENVVCCIDEALVSREMYPSLKHSTTTEDVVINEKYKAPRVQRNYLNQILLTNEDLVLKGMSKDDRRMIMLESNPEWNNEDKWPEEKKHEYLSPLYEAMLDDPEDTVSQLFWFFQHLDLTQWLQIRHTHILHSKPYDRAVYAGLNGAQKCIITMCVRGYTLPVNCFQSIGVDLDPEYPKWQMKPPLDELMKYWKKDGELHFGAAELRGTLKKLKVMETLHLESFQVLVFPTYVEFLRRVQKMMKLDLRNIVDDVGDFAMQVPALERPGLVIKTAGPKFDVIRDMKYG